MGFSEREVGHMPPEKFTRLYRAYKNNFDLEMMMKLKGITYAELSKEQTLNDVIPH